MLGAQSAIALDNARLFREILEERNYSENVLRSLTNGVMTFDTAHNAVKINDKVRRTERTDVSMGAEIITGQDTVTSVNLNISALIGSQGASLGDAMVIEDITNDKRVRSTMARYMTLEIADQVLENGDSVLGGRAQLATVVFTDIKDFTVLSERIGPQDTVSLLNSYFTEMVEVVVAHHGILDKYIGDAIMAVFGAPFPSPHDADNAVQMALKMRGVLAKFNESHVTESRQPLEIRIGINSDQVVAGNIGSERRMDCTVIGDGVNLAERLESANKQLGTDLLVSGLTVELLRDNYHLRELDLLQVKGKTNPVAVYEVIGTAQQALSQELAPQHSHFAAGLKAYRSRDWRGAGKLVVNALNLNPDHIPSQLLLERTQHYEAEPPTDDWDGVSTEQIGSQLA